MRNQMNQGLIMKRTYLIITCILTLSSSRAMETEEDFSSTTDFVLKHEELLEKACVERDNDHIPIFNVCELIEQIKNGERDESIFKSLLRQCHDESATGELSSGVRSFYIQDDVVVELYIAALGDDALRSQACKILRFNVGNKTKSRFASEIKTALGSVLPEQVPLRKLYSKCQLSDQYKKEILTRIKEQSLGSEGYSDWFDRALFGDDEALDKIINEFITCNDYQRAKTMASDLGYIGSRKCAEALVEKLTTDLYLNTGQGLLSLRVELLRQLGMIYDNESMFTTDVMMLELLGSRRLDEIKGYDKYVNEVNSWVEKEFGHPAWNNPDDVWFDGWDVVEENGKIKVKSKHLYPTIEELREKGTKEREEASKALAVP